jgi:hypothetical protein
MGKFIYIILLTFTILINANSQTNPLSDNSRVTKIIERLAIKYPNQSISHTSLDIDVNSAIKYSGFLSDSVKDLSDKDIENINFISEGLTDWDSETLKAGEQKVASRKGIINVFYKNKSNFYAIHKDKFFMTVNPILNINVGKDIKNDRLIFQNLRGISFAGIVDKKISFYTSIIETQQSFLTHIENKINRDLAIPGQGLYKNFNSSVLDEVIGYDFLNSQANISFNLTKSITTQLGHGKFKIGNGIRSLLLSDYGQNYFYLKFDTRVWKFHYQNIFTELAAVSHRQIAGDQLVPKKYMAAHYLNFAANKNFEAGIFETVIFKRDNHFELQYLNPIILYRSVEHFIGSPDNVLVGMDIKYNFFKRFSIYAQLLLDEFNFSILKDDSSWWGNKYGVQLGIKYIDAFNIDQMDLIIEANYVRPYTYSHNDSLKSYSHYNQALAHPLGGNFKEIIIDLDYMITRKWFINANAIFAIQGIDKDGYSYGSNILRSNAFRPLDEQGLLIDYGYQVGSGIKKQLSQYKINLSYMIFYNYYLDFNAIYFKEKIENSPSTGELFFGAGIRMNINMTNPDY